MLQSVSAGSVYYIRNISQVVWLARCPSLTLPQSTVHLCFSMHVQPTDTILCLFPAQYQRDDSLRVTSSKFPHAKKKKLNLGHCACVCVSSVFHLIVGVLDDSVERWHQGLL